MTAKNMVEAIRDALAEEMERDPTVVLLGEDVGRKGGVFKTSDGLQARFGPLRVLDTPVAEIAIAGVAIGAAMTGLRPVAEFQFADYMHPAYDQIVSQAATMRWRSVGTWHVPVVFRAPFGAVAGGGIYHSQSPEAPYCHTPGLKVVAPATPSDAKGLLKAAIRDDDPVIFFEHKANYRTIREEVGVDPVPLGVARVDRDGGDVSIVTYAGGVHVAREAATALAEEGINVAILDLRTLVPLDREAIAATVKRTGRLLILHEANKTMGFGAEIAAFAAEELFMDLDAPVRRVAAADSHLTYNTSEQSAILPDAQDVIAAVRELLRY
ncbi:MAG: 2-oxoisovalerate dehydrogenase component beta subunit [Acidimicrobiaceae bacterium]|jgi:2-oxoisovalerate dehydrogenase E1 component beta subunit